MSFASSFDARSSNDCAPMGEMNTTPLIDVMLVLLIMFIITIPAATHSVEVELPSHSEPPVPVEFNSVSNKLVLAADDRLLWNGAAVGEADLPGILDASRSLTPEPELQFQPDALASYQTANRVLKAIKQSGVARFGFVGNEQYRDFTRAE